MEKSSIGTGHVITTYIGYFRFFIFIKIFVYHIFMN